MERRDFIKAAVGAAGPADIVAQTTQGGQAAPTGVDTMAILQQARATVRSFQPFTPQQRAELLGRTADAARDGQAERHRTSTPFDGTVQNPQWLG